MKRVVMVAWMACAFGAGWLLREPWPGVVEFTDVGLYQGEWQDVPFEEASADSSSDGITDRLLEQALYTEQERLQYQLDRVVPGIAGLPELYFLGIAGDGTQRVFGREIDFVGERLQQRFDLHEHQLLLINDRTRIGSVAMATRTSVQQALQTLAQRMNPDEDVLLVYMTSHGSQTHDFILEQEGLLLPDLSADSVRELLDQSGIRWQVVIVSACFSGGLLPMLQNPDRLIMTSAAADRSSFGCSDDSEMTYFGRALFDEAFASHAQWPAMFTAARGWIEQRETEEGIEPSYPQIAVGANILSQLDRIAVKDAL